MLEHELKNAVSSVKMTPAKKEALAQALLGLIRDAETRRRMGAEAARRADRFDFETIMKQWDQLFRQYENPAVR